jgi:hypothetical protein
MKKIYFLFNLLCTGFFIQAQDLNAFYEKTNDFMSKNVIKNKVKYGTIKSNPALLNEILDNAAKVDLNGVDKIKVKAFWINAYNLCVIKGIVEKYPVKSAIDVQGFFDKATYKLAKEDLTLDDIEKKKLIAVFNDPYIHFALVCGANGCPPLISGAYMPESIYNQMYEQAGMALNNAEFIRVNKATKTAEISKIFEWYKADFTSSYKRPIDFINLFREERITDDYKVVIYEYDWTLNNIE